MEPHLLRLRVRTVILTPFKPVFRWLQGNDVGSPGTMSDVFYVTRRDHQYSANQVEYRAPKCDAIYLKGDVVELAVCYQVRYIPQYQIDDQLGEDFWNNPDYPNVPGEPPWSEKNEDWDIGLTILQ